MFTLLNVACALIAASAIVVLFQLIHGSSKVDERIKRAMLAASAFTFASHFFWVAENNGLAGVGFLMVGFILITGLFSSEQRDV